MALMLCLRCQTDSKYWTGGFTSLAPGGRLRSCFRPDEALLLIWRRQGEKAGHADSEGIVVLTACRTNQWR